jgi:hypothetical protein
MKENCLESERMKHSELPFEIIEEDSTIINGHMHRYVSIGNNIPDGEFGGTGIAVCILPEENDSPQDRELIRANADFIVTACNNHEALVEALELCAEILENIHTGSDDECECWEAADKAKAALARVREEEK